MKPVIALLGRPDTPSDGVQDYCEFLGRALKSRGIELTITRVDWFQDGWIRALAQLRQAARQWRGRWIILQYTALAWSRHGLPLGLLPVIAVLRHSGARCAIVYHEPYRQEGSGRLRGGCQGYVIQKMYRHAHKAIFPDPLETIDWLPNNETKAAFIPIGANVTTNIATAVNPELNRRVKTIVLFCLSRQPNASMEIEDISHAARSAAAKSLPLRFVFFGRGTSEAKEEIESAFRNIPVEISFLGLIRSNEIGCVLAQSDVMLCVRGAITPRRGSAIAGIAFGLPIVGYQGVGTGFPITEAGLELVTYRDKQALGRALCNVVADERLRQNLGRRSRRAHEDYFSWEKIAERFVQELFTD
jgi:glycosyltransferase involved in cell wall biosynthesis